MTIARLVLAPQTSSLSPTCATVCPSQVYLHVVSSNTCRLRRSAAHRRRLPHQLAIATGMDGGRVSAVWHNLWRCKKIRMVEHMQQCNTAPPHNRCSAHPRSMYRAHMDPWVRCSLCRPPRHRHVHPTRGYGQDARIAAHYASTAHPVLQWLGSTLIPAQLHQAAHTPTHLHSHCQPEFRCRLLLRITCNTRPYLFMRVPPPRLRCLGQRDYLRHQPCLVQIRRRFRCQQA